MFNWPRVQLYLNVPHHIHVLKWQIIDCLIYFGFIECLYMPLFWQVFGGNTRVIQNWVKNSSYAWLSFVKKINVMYFFAIFHVKFFLVRSLRLRESAVELTHSPRVWVSWVSTSPLVYYLKRPINYCCRICTILCMIFKKRLFIEVLCRPLFTKYAHCKPLFPVKIVHNE